MLKGGDPFLQTQEIYETEPLPILRSAIQTVLHWYWEEEYSDCCAYILAMINYSNNPVTNVGRDPDASIVKDED